MTESNVPPPPPSPDDPNVVPPPPLSAAAEGAAPGTPVPYAGPMTSSGYPGPYVGPPPDQNAKTQGMLCHILSLAGIVIPFGNIIGPLIIWQMKKNEHPFIDDQGKESVNFQILVTGALLISAALMCVVIGFFMLPVVGLVGLIMSILAGVKANNGEPYRYPFNIRFIK
jgi:uncharacterized Tic20 family protein